MSFTPRYTDPGKTNPPAAWESPGSGQCVWYTFGRCRETAGVAYPEVSGRPTSGSISYAKQMYANPNTAYGWTSSTTNPNVGDVVCWNGPYGHCANIEAISGNYVTITDYNKVAEETFACQQMTFEQLYAYNGSGNFQGYIHNPYTTGGGGGGGGGDDPTPTGPTYTQVISNINNPNLTEDITFTKMSGNFTYKWGTSASSQGNTFTPTISGTTCTYNAGNSFENLIGANASSKLFYFSASNSSYVQALPLEARITVPDTYKPVLTLGTVVKGNTFNNNLIAGYSTMSLTYNASPGAPTGYTNSAVVTGTTFEVNKGTLVKTGTTSGNITVTASGSVDDYSVTLTGTATDTRNFVTNGTSALGNVRGYYTPEVETHSIYRCDETGKYDTSGEYIKCTFSFMLACDDIGNTVNPSDIVVNIDQQTYQNEVTIDSEGNYTFFIQIGSNFNVIDSEGNISASITYHDTIMTTFGIADKTSGNLQVFRMPLSLLDDNLNRVGVAFGTEAVTPNTVEFAPNMYVKATDYDGTAYVKRAVELFGIAGDIEALRTYILQTILGGLKFEAMSEAQYAALATKENDKIYFIYEN